MFIRTWDAVYAADAGDGSGGSAATDMKSDAEKPDESKGAADGEEKKEDKKASASDLPQTLEDAIKELTELRAMRGQMPKWASDRIDVLTKSWRETERERDALKGQVEQLKTAKPSAQVGFTAAQVAEEAQRIADDKLFSDATNKVLAEGRKTNPAFDTALQALHNISPVMVQTAQGAVPNMPRSFVEAVIELDKPAEVLSALALPINHDEAARIMALPPSRQGVALSRFQAGLVPEKEISRTPAPGTQVITGRASGTRSTYDAGKMPTAEWMELRNKELREKQKRA
jgi:hypothetical protein